MNTNKLFDLVFAMDRQRLAFLGLMFLVVPVHGMTGGFTFEEKQIEVNSGYIKLTWDSDEKSIYILQQSDSPDFSQAKTIYEGPDKASFISGLENGQYFFRIQPRDNSWSDTIRVDVSHQSLELAITLFILGAVVFLLTVFVVIHGVWRTANETY